MRPFDTSNGFAQKGGLAKKSPENRTFCAKPGDSMDLALAGFRSGDVVAVREGGDPRNGDVVIARIGEEITLKRFYRNPENVELQPISSNPEHGTIRVDSLSDFEISGIVVGAIIGTRRE